MTSPTGRQRDNDSQQYASALRDMARRYEKLVKGYSILRQLDAIDHPDIKLEEICLRLLDTIAQGLSAENCSLMLLDDKGEYLELWAACSPVEDRGSFVGPGFWTGKRFRIGEGIAGEAAASGKPIRLDDVEGEIEFLPIPGSPVNVRALMCFPLCVDDEPIGVLNLSHSKACYFSIESERIVALVAERCARLLASHRVHYRHRQSEEYYRLVAEKAGDAILVLDDEGRVVKANPAVGQIAHAPLETFLNGEAEWIDSVVEGDRAMLLAHRTRVLESRAHEVVEYRFRDAHGLVHHLEERSWGLHDPSVQQSGIMCVIRDVTERKEIEEEKRQIEAQLRQAQKMEAIGELAGGVAHDFNNLLTGILGNVSLARTLDEPAAIHELLEQAEGASIRAAELVKQLLVFSRRSDAAKRPIELSTVLDETENIIRNTFDRRIEISVEKEEGLRAVYVDPGQIHQVLINLCVNARDALLAKAKRDPDAPLHLTLAATNADIDEVYCRTRLEATPGQFVSIMVDDTGIGMDTATQTRAFEPFFTTKGSQEGTGLGLAIVYGIVKQHGGWIRVHSVTGKGSNFRVFLPVAEAAEAPPPPAPTEIQVRGGTETILLVDDEAIVRNLGKSILERLGYSVLLASDGKEGLEFYQRDREQVDLVLLDLCMPRLAGDEVLKRIRDENPRAKIILSSGHTMDWPSDLFGVFEPSGYLRKPYTCEEMARAVRRVLDQAG